MAELTDEQLAKMRSRYHGEGTPSPWQIRDDLGAALDEIDRLRAARAELVEGLRPWAGAARISAMNLPGIAPMTDDVRVSAGTLGDCRRAAKLVARHGGD